MNDLPDGYKSRLRVKIGGVLHKGVSSLDDYLPVFRDSILQGALQQLETPNPCVAKPYHVGSDVAYIWFRPKENHDDRRRIKRLEKFNYDPETWWK